MCRMLFRNMSIVWISAYKTTRLHKINTEILWRWLRRCCLRRCFADRRPCNLVVPATSYPGMYVKFWMQSVPILYGMFRNQLVVIIEPVGVRIALEDHETPDLLRIRRLVIPEKDVFIGHSRDLDLSGRM